jgi:hypothetical protein
MEEKRSNFCFFNQSNIQTISVLPDLLYKYKYMYKTGKVFTQFLMNLRP